MRKLLLDMVHPARNCLIIVENSSRLGAKDLSNERVLHESIGDQSSAKSVVLEIGLTSGDDSLSSGFEGSVRAWLAVAELAHKVVERWDDRRVGSEGWHQLGILEG